MNHKVNKKKRNKFRNQIIFPSNIYSKKQLKCTNKTFRKTIKIIQNLIQNYVLHNLLINILIDIITCKWEFF
jgi:hypothetical protein